MLINVICYLLLESIFKVISIFLRYELLCVCISYELLLSRYTISDAMTDAVEFQ